VSADASEQERERVQEKEREREMREMLCPKMRSTKFNKVHMSWCTVSECVSVCVCV